MSYTHTYFSTHLGDKKNKRTLTKNVCWRGEGTDMFLFCSVLRGKLPVCLTKKNLKNLIEKFCGKYLQPFLLTVKLTFPTISLKQPLVLTDVLLESAWASELILNGHKKSAAFLLHIIWTLSCFLPDIIDLTSIMQLLFYLQEAKTSDAEHMSLAVNVIYFSRSIA